VFVVKKGRPLPLPDGVMMIIPTEFWPFITSPLISWPGKLRMGLDFFIPPRTDGEDETIAEFVSRRLGSEAVDRLAEPLMSGIYNAEANRQSVLATFPRFRDVESKYGSLIRGMLAARKARKGAPRPKHAMFVSLKTGTRELVEALVAQLDVDLRLNSPVDTIRESGESYEVVLSGGDRLHADALVMTTPAFVTANLLRNMFPGAAEKLAAIRYVSTGTLSMAFRKDEIGHPLDGFGLVIPVSEGRQINAVTWTSTKFDHRAPVGYDLLRVFFGGSRRPEMMEKSDEEILRIAREELADLMGITASPVSHRLYRWMDSNPQYDSGHLGRIDSIEAELPPGLYLAGSAYRGIGIPDCVHQAQQAAERVVPRIKEIGLFE
jgi:oxygen-dependent protoporphyrinogen oxidase